MSDLPAIIENAVDAQQAQRLRDAIAWVAAEASGDEAAAMFDTARKVRAYVKVINGAHELVVEATRLECAALRRLAQLGKPEAAGGRRRSVAMWLGSLSDDEFATWMERAERHAGAQGLYNAMGREATQAGWREVGRDLAAGEPFHPTRDERDYGRSLAQLSRAAGALLNRHSSHDAPFRVTEVAQELAEWLDQAAAFACDAAVREGYCEVVRAAIAADDGGVRQPGDAPAWVTYEDDPIGWVRVPWASASIVQFRSMVTLRRKQLADLQKVVGVLEGVLSAVEEQHGAHPEITSVATLGGMAASGMWVVTDAERAADAREGTLRAEDERGELVQAVGS